MTMTEGQQGTLWVECECRHTEYSIRTFRGRVSSSELDSLTSGGKIDFLRLRDCYWCKEVEEEAEAAKIPGGFDRLGYGMYVNFTGEMFLRCSSILNVSLLKSGFEGEFAGNRQAH